MSRDVSPPLSCPGPAPHAQQSCHPRPAALPLLLCTQGPASPRSLSVCQQRPVLRSAGHSGLPSPALRTPTQPSVAVFHPWGEHPGLLHGPSCVCTIPGTSPKSMASNSASVHHSAHAPPESWGPTAQASLAHWSSCFISGCSSAPHLCLSTPTSPGGPPPAATASGQLPGSSQS